MSAFTATFIAVLTMLAYAMPGYILIRRRMISTECIPGFSKVLLYVCQPFLAIHTFCSAEYSTQMLLQILMFAGACVTSERAALGIRVIGEEEFVKIIENFLFKTS